MTESLPTITIHDRRESGLLAHALDGEDRAKRVMQTVIAGLGLAGKVLGPILPMADRMADRRLIAMNDPYRDEIVAIRERLGRAGPIAFNLSYEFGCTARVFPDGMLFRTLDWPFRGLGDLVEIVKLRGPAGDWVTATWPGVVGCLHGSAPGRFAIALNQAPERTTGFGRAVDWIASKRQFLKATGLPPPHLLRQVFETAPDYAKARQMLMEVPVAAPVIYTVAGPQGEACTIERTETHASVTEAPAAANHFETDVTGGNRWRARGYDSIGRRAALLRETEVPALDGLVPPVLNPLTRLAMHLGTDGSLTVAGYDGAERITAVTSASV